MRRLVLVALLAVAAVSLLAASAAARSDSSVRVRGVVALKDAPSRIVTVRTKRHAVALRVPGSQRAIRVGQPVELRGSTLRARGSGSRVLARNVTIASSAPLDTPQAPKRDDNDEDDDDDRGGRGDDVDDDRSGPGDDDDRDEDDDSGSGSRDDDDDDDDDRDDDDDDDD